MHIGAKTTGLAEVEEVIALLQDSPEKCAEFKLPAIPRSQNPPPTKRADHIPTKRNNKKEDSTDTVIKTVDETFGFDEKQVSSSVTNPALEYGSQPW